MQNVIQNQMINHFKQVVFEAADKIRSKHKQQGNVESIFKILEFEKSQKHSLTIAEKQLSQIC